MRRVIQMVEIPEPVARMVKHPDTHKVLSTVSPEGEPHSIVCASLTMHGNDTIVVAEVYMHRTCENLAKDPRAEFLVWQGKDAYSIKAVAKSRQTEGELFDKMSAAMDKFNLLTVAVWEFEVTEIWDESASISAGDRVV